MSQLVSTARASVVVAGEALASEFQPVYNPARTDEVVGEVAVGTAEHVEQAVAAASAAFRAWSSMPVQERAAFLLAAADELAGHVEDLATLLTREQGKVRWESVIDVGGAAKILRYYTGLADRLAADEVFRQDERGTIYVGRRPVGVTGIIVPWNSPVYLAFLGLAPALLAGNTVVVKPSEYAPLALGRILEVLAAHLPPGVVNTVPGGAEAGSALVAHPRVRKVFFTGSTATGQQVMRAAAGNLKNLSLELGGNDPAIVLASARIDERLVDELVRAVFTLSGQICFDVKRIYVHESHYADFVEQYVAAVDRIVVGDGLDPRTTIGPVNNRPQFERIQGLLDRTRTAGATVHTVGTKLDPVGWDRGLFLLPSVVTDVEPGAEIVGCEQFGPVVPVLPYQTDEQAIALANDTEFGLSASIWSEDREHALALARRLECGSVFLNVHRLGASDMSMPFGGFKGSGIGRGHGMYSLDACTELQAVADYVDVSGFPGPGPR
ncbi:aldehyde dehydrogenase family protein [Plantactinospora sp. S1510]|uniref:Aldehyde dehydrogenase family protein n=1 Tax=Plantactinospora alkalitolerans TaxID=2789879 RepID=A0ABS0GS55_9ACTN|nr:aldehyde dehydrogenase family protein [Plantactinospora alkalitolerans]MBF9128828.1 aldehyde dehydrogenase family protein [Plantactinospora alkalitolerans]